MIYLKAGKDRIVILEPGNLDRLQKAEPAVTPDGEIFIAYTPDALWLAQELQKVGHALTTPVLDALLEASQKRPPVRLKSDQVAKVLINKSGGIVH